MILGSSHCSKSLGWPGGFAAVGTAAHRIDLRRITARFGVMSEPILFREILQQHQALSQRGWAIVFCALGLFFTGFGLAMFINGAWPVIGFLGVEVGALYVGYRVMTGRARRQEEVILTPSTLSLHLRDPRGRLQRQSFPARDCAVMINRPTTWDDPVVLRAGNRRIPFGGDLNPDQRQDVADRLLKALSEARKFANP